MLIKNNNKYTLKLKTYLIKIKWPLNTNVKSMKYWDKTVEL